MKNKLQYDVLIIGAGPAGIATALMLKQHAPEYSVAVLESGKGKKRMMESLTPVGAAFLRQLGIWKAFVGENYPCAFGSAAAWGSPEIYEHEFIYQTSGNGWHLDRVQFDAFLRKQIVEKNIILRKNSAYCGHRYNGNRWHIHVNEAGIKKEIQAAFVVDASGRNAEFAKREDARKLRMDQLVGVFGVFKQDVYENDFASYTFVESCESGWWYAAKTAEHNWVLAWMSDSDLVKKDEMLKSENFLNKLSKSLHTSRRVQNSKLLDDPQIFPAASFQLDTLGGEGWVATGDAACTYDPLSSGGMVKALRTGIFTAYVALDHFKGIGDIGLQKYNRLMKEDYETYLETRQKFYQEETRWADAPFWKRRHVRNKETVFT